MVLIVYGTDSKLFSYKINFTESNKNFSVNFTTPDSITAISFLGNLNSSFQTYNNLSYYSYGPTGNKISKPITQNSTHILIRTEEITSPIIAIRKNSTIIEGRWNVTWDLTVANLNIQKMKDILIDGEIIYILNITAGQEYILKGNLSTNPITILSSSYLATEDNYNSIRGIGKNGTTLWVTTDDGFDGIIMQLDSNFKNVANYTVLGGDNYYSDVTVVENEIWVSERGINLTHRLNLSNPTQYLGNITIPYGYIVTGNSHQKLSYQNGSLWATGYFNDASDAGTTYITEWGGKPQFINFYLDGTIQKEIKKNFDNLTDEDFNTTRLNDRYYCSKLNEDNQCNFTAYFESKNMGELEVIFNLTYLPYILSYSTEKILETSQQTFWFSIVNLTNSTDINAYFVYNGTPQTLTKTVYPAYTNFTTIFYLPISQYNKLMFNYSFYFEYNHTYLNQTNESRTSYTYNQSIYDLVVSNCTGEYIPADAIALNITFYDYNDLILITDYKATTFYGLSFERMNQNYSYENSIINSVTYCIYPNWTNIQVNQQNRWYDGSNYYDYFLYNNTFNNVTQYLKLYTQNSSEITQVLFTVQDTNSDPLQDAYLHILRYDVGTGTYTTQEILKTDSQGQAIGNIVLYNVYYNFLIYYNGKLVSTEQAVKLIISTRTFTVNLEGIEWIENFETAYGINYDLYFNNVTDNFVFTWSDPSSSSHYGCLKIDVTNSSGKYNLSNHCVQSASSTIVYGIFPYNGTTFTAAGYVKFDDDIVLKIIQKVWEAPRDFFFREMPIFSLFLTSIIIITLFCIGLPHPTIALSLMGGGLIITSLIGMFMVTPVILGGIIFLILIQIHLASRK